MKKYAGFISVMAFSVFIFCTAVFAAEVDLKSFSDDDLKALYEEVREEMTARGISIGGEITLREGKFIVGEDILPGTYTITCLETDGEKIGDAYSALGDALNSLGDGNDGSGALMDTLGGMMEDVVTAQVQILGDYGSVLKSFELKGGERSTIALEGNTAVEITGGTCRLESQ